MEGRGERKGEDAEGRVVLALDAELVRERGRAEGLLRRFRAGEDQAVLRELLGAIGHGTTVREPFYCGYGSNIRLGANAFVNFGCVMLDVCVITIGDGCQIGPGVQIYAADHPRDAEVRRSGLEFGRPVEIERNVWIGGAAVILPGVRVGDDVVIGAGSVVTRDVEAGSTVMGNPARPKPKG